MSFTGKSNVQSSLLTLVSLHLVKSLHWGLLVRMSSFSCFIPATGRGKKTPLHLSPQIPNLVPFHGGPQLQGLDLPPPRKHDIVSSCKRTLSSTILKVYLKSILAGCIEPTDNTAFLAAGSSTTDPFLKISHCQLNMCVDPKISGSIIVKFQTNLFLLNSKLHQLPLQFLHGDATRSGVIVDFAL